jgi:hypothetical protein
MSWGKRAPLGRRSVPWWAWAVSCGLLCGCQYFSDTSKVDSLDQAASVRVSPVMIAPWQDVESALQPNFAMSGDTAASEVLPTTSRVQNQFLDAVTASLDVGVQHTASASQETPPTVPSGIPAGAQALSPGASASTLGIDPELKYKAANYLNEQVQLLNKEVQNVVSRRCMAPYLLKLKIAVMPHKPKIAYSAHAYISFFRKNGSRNTTDSYVASGDNPCEGGTSALPVVVPLIAADNINIALKSSTAELATQLGLALSLMTHKVGASADFNSLRQEINSISDQELSSTLTVTTQPPNMLYVRIAPNNEQDDPILVGQTYDIAALLLVPIGYFKSYPSESCGADPCRSIDITSRTYTQLRDTDNGESLSSGKDKIIRNKIEELSKNWIETDNHAVFWKIMEEKSSEQFLLKLINSAQDESYADFVDIIQSIKNCSPAFALTGTTPPSCTLPGEKNICITPTDDDKSAGNCPSLFKPQDYSSIWALLNMLLTEIPDSTFNFEVKNPLFPPPALSTDQNENTIVIDDGKQTAKVVLYNVDVQSTTGFSAYLTIPPDAPASTASAPLPAQSMALDPLSRELTLTFPSPQKLGLRKPPSAPLVASKAKAKNRPQTNTSPSYTQATLFIWRPCLDLDPSNVPDACKGADTTLPVRIITAPSEPDSTSSGLKLAQGSDVIDESADGKGVMTLAVSGLSSAKGQSRTSTVAIAISGADVSAAQSAAGSALKLGDNGYVVPQNGMYTFHLFNLSPGAKVTAKAQELTAQPGGKPPTPGSSATATFAVIGLAAEAHR